jgi:hypothetical protein
MQLYEWVLFVCLALFGVGATLILYFIFYRPDFGKANSLERQVPLVRGRPILHTPLHGACEVVRVRGLGDNKSRYDLKDLHGGFWKVTLWNDEVEPKDITQIIAGPGNPEYVYRPSKERLLNALRIEGTLDRHTAATVAAKQQAEKAATDNALLRAGDKLEVNQRIEQVALLHKAGQQPAVVRR